MGNKDTEFSLTHDEIALLSDPSFFIRKKLVTGSVVDLFGKLDAAYDLISQKHRTILPEGLQHRRGKISRGENYRGLPYVILDAPALFEKKGVFAFRTLMWWGHPFSFTFHLAGCYFDHYIDALFPALEKLSPETFICINTKQWEHHHEPSNYLPLSKFQESTDNHLNYFKKKGFLKLSKLVTLDDHQKLTQTGIGFLDSILTQLK